MFLKGILINYSFGSANGLGTRPLYEQLFQIVFNAFMRLPVFNTLRPGRKWRENPDDIFSWIFLNENIK